ncbi:cytochrome P450 [Mycena leptocephala]|nr:cytochrome P450 [Mycena leptocephala]
MAHYRKFCYNGIHILPCAVGGSNPVVGSYTDRDRLRKFEVANAFRRSKSAATTKDLWYHFGWLEKEKPALGDVVADGATAVIAGADTTASALSSLFFFLLSYPKYYEKLQEEVDSHFALGVDPLETSSHADMKFLNACISNDMFLATKHCVSILQSLKRTTTSSQGKVIAGLFIPEGTQVYVPPYSLHLDLRYFSPAPEKFMPERCIEPSLRPNATAFIPFSYGPSNCVGRNLARQEMAMVTCLLLNRLDIQFAPGFDAAA